MMFHDGDDNFIALFDVGSAVGLGHQVDTLGGAPDKNDFVAGPGVDELPDLGTDPFIGVRCLLAQIVNPPVDVCILRRVILLEGINHGLWLLGGGGIVEVNQGFPVDFLV